MNKTGIFNLKGKYKGRENLKNLTNLLGQNKERAKDYGKIIFALKAAIKASGYPIERLKIDRTLGVKVYRQIFYWHCVENNLGSFAVAARFFDQDRVTCYKSWQVVQSMVETKDDLYLSAIEKFEHSLSMLELSYEKLILAIKFDALSMSDSAFLEKYSTLLF